jgi:hypothetical protein
MERGRNKHDFETTVLIYIVYTYFLLEYIEGSTGQPMLEEPHQDDILILNMIVLYIWLHHHNNDNMYIYWGSIQSYATKHKHFIWKNNKFSNITIHIMMLTVLHIFSTIKSQACYVVTFCDFDILLIISNKKSILNICICCFHP